MARWGHFGAPVLIFPTAGGDFEEIERFHLIDALGELIDSGRLKVYSIDGTAVRAWLAGNLSPAQCARQQDLYDSFVHEEVLQRMRQDCHSERIEPVLAGCSLGAFFAITGLCRHPDAFRSAIGVSGDYDLAKSLSGLPGSQIGAFSPAQYLSEPHAPLAALRTRHFVLGSGEGDYENPAESCALADLLTSKGVPCRLELWGPHSHHSWAAWLRTLPPLLAGIT